MKKVSLLSILIFLVSGCVTPAKQTEVILSAPGSLPAFHEIKQVTFIDQTAGYCGPAALTMAMRWAGQKVTLDEVALQVYTPGMQGSLQSDLISASRRQGLMAVSISNLSSLLTEVAAGHPVIIFENLGLSWAPQWHYALVLGYDLKKQEIIMHSGHSAFYHWDLKKFERSWMLGDYWGLVVLPPGELAVSADELANVTAAVGLEQAAKYKEAEKSYRQILEKWPTSLVALIGLANLAYKKGHRNEAGTLLRRAVKNHPESTAAQHNLVVVESQ